MRRCDLLAVPGLAIAGGWRSQVVVSLVLPGTTWDTSRTQQILALRHEPHDDDERKAAEHTRDWFHDVVMDEDYLTGYGVQRGLEALTERTSCSAATNRACSTSTRF